MAPATGAPEPLTVSVAEPQSVAAPRLGRGVRVPRLLAAEPSLTLFIAVYACVVVALARAELVPDSWLLLVGGREVARSGLPAHDTLVVLAHGRRWVDQQWLAQLGAYGLERAGGVRLALLALAAASTGALVLAVAAARTLGASARSIVVVAAAAVFLAPAALQLRAQTPALLLFAALLALLTRETLRQSRRVLFVFPLLALWANVHGSALMGGAVVLLYAGTVARGQPRRGALLAVTAPLCLLASPYATQLPGYYARTVVSPLLAKYSQEWQPLSWSHGKAFLLAVLAALWLVARHGRRLPLFAQVTFALTAVAAIAAVRNLVWLELSLVGFAPSALDALWQPPARRGRHPLGVVWLGAAAAVGAVVVTVVVASRPAAWFESQWDVHAAAATARALAADPRARVFASDEYTDWLLWKEPALRGRLAYDARFELLTRAQLESVSTGRRAFAARFPVALLDREQDAAAARALERRGYRRVYARGSALLLARNCAIAGRSAGSRTRSQCDASAISSVSAP